MSDETDGQPPPAGAPGKRLMGWALPSIGVMVFFAALGVGMWKWQEYCAPPGPPGPPRPPPWAWLLPSPAPPPPPPRPQFKEPSEMTPAIYERLQRLPPYGVVRPGSALEAKLKNATSPRPDGGS